MIALTHSPAYAARVADSFWQRAETTHSSMAEQEFDYYYRQIRAVTAPRPDQSIADFGCGEGSIALLFQRDGFDIVGTDISRQFVAACQARGLRCCPVDEFFGQPQKYDIILVNGAFFYVHPRRRSGLLSRLRGKLKDGGRLCILDEPDLRKRHLVSRHPVKRLVWALLPIYDPESAAFFNDMQATASLARRCGFSGAQVSDSWGPQRSHLVLTA